MANVCTTGSSKTGLVAFFAGTSCYVANVAAHPFSMYKVEDLHQFNFRLTSLWALSEIGGSLLNTLKLPFSGLLISVCSVLILALFFQANRDNEKPVAIAFLVVTVVKFACNPVGSPLAFLALFFQTGCCMMAFRYIQPFQRGAVVAGVACLLHTCAQQLLLRPDEIDFWQFKTAFLPTAMLDRFILDLVKSNLFFEIAYILLFLLTGWVTGLFATRLPALIERETQFLHTLETLPKPVLTPKQQKKLDKKNAKKSKYGIPKMLLLAGGAALVTGNFHSAVQVFQFALLWLVVFTDFFQRQVVPRVQFALTSRFYPQYLDRPESAGNFGKMSGLIHSAWLLAKAEQAAAPRVGRFVALVFALGLGDFSHS